MGRISPSHLINTDNRYCHIININNIILCNALLNMTYIYIYIYIYTHTNQVEQKDTVDTTQKKKLFSQLKLKL